MLSASDYINCVRLHLHAPYIQWECDEGGGEIQLTERTGRGRKRTVTLLAPEKGIVFKLDLPHPKGNRSQEPLFHFLNNQDRPWASRCDFVVFWTSGGNFMADCIEFKTSTLLASGIQPQLDAGFNWCRSLKNVINNYTEQEAAMQVRKFVFGTNETPGKRLNDNNQLSGDPSIRYYHYDDVQGRSLTELENAQTETI